MIAIIVTKPRLCSLGSVNLARSSTGFLEFVWRGFRRRFAYLCTMVIKPKLSTKLNLNHSLSVLTLYHRSHIFTLCQKITYNSQKNYTHQHMEECYAIVAMVVALALFQLDSLCISYCAQDLREGLGRLYAPKTNL